MTKPKLIYKAVITSGGEINTLIFPSFNNAQQDILKPLHEYSRATTITLGAITRVISRLTDHTFCGTSKRVALEYLEQFREKHAVSNEALCDLFAEEIYLPLIIPVKNMIPTEIKSKYSELQ